MIIDMALKRRKTSNRELEKVILQKNYVAESEFEREKIKDE